MISDDVKWAHLVQKNIKNSPRVWRHSKEKCLEATNRQENIKTAKIKMFCRTMKVIKGIVTQKHLIELKNVSKLQLMWCKIKYV